MLCAIFVPRFCFAHCLESVRNLWQHVRNPTKSVAHCVVWGLCYLMLCAIFVPSALTDDLHLTDCLLCVCTLAVTNCWFRKLATAKRRKILQCQFVRKRRHKHWRGIFRCRHRSCRPSPITCICVKPCVPDAHEPECDNASDVFQWHHLRGGTGVPPTQPRRSVMNMLCSTVCKKGQVMSQNPAVPMSRMCPPKIGQTRRARRTAFAEPFERSRCCCQCHQATCQH